MERVCAECGTTGFGFKNCSRCKKREYYCGKPCQKRHWKIHKKTCRAPPAAATPPAEGADEKDEGRLFRGINAEEEKRIGSRSTNVRYDHCSGCGEPRSEDRPLRRCGRCNSVWYCSRECHERNWREPPWGKARGIVASWASHRTHHDAIQSTMNPQGHCIVPHRDVCPLLKELRRDAKKQEERLRDGMKNDQEYAALAIAAIGRGQIGTAEAAIRQAIHLNPAHCLYHDDLGYVLTRKGEFDKSIEARRVAIRLDPTRATLHFNLGNTFAIIDEFDKAIEAFRQAVRLDPTESDSHFNLGKTLEAIGELDKAIEAYGEAIRLNPTCASFHLNLGCALGNSGEIGKAIEAYREAIRLDPTDADYHNRVGCEFLNKCEFDKALEACREAIRLDPTQARFHGNLGNAFQGKNELDEAIEAYDEAIQLEPADPRLHAARGFALTHDCEFEEAMRLTARPFGWSRQMPIINAPSTASSS